jgi:hypothetical protein
MASVVPLLFLHLLFTLDHVVLLLLLLLLLARSW